MGLAPSYAAVLLLAPRQSAPSQPAHRSIAQRLPGERLGRYDSLAFLDRDGLPSSNIFELVNFPAGPLDSDRGHFSFLSEAKRKHEFALRQIAGTAPLHLPLLPTRILDSRHGANAISI